MDPRALKKLAALLALLIGASLWLNDLPHSAAPASAELQTSSPPLSLGRADSNRQVQGEGVVIKLLADDNEGRRHQKFILKLASGQTLLVAHDIDLAPRVSPLAVGDTVAFNGEYEWNERGGVVHWTHHDPRSRHQDGWLKAAGRTYQ